MAKVIHFAHKISTRLWVFAWRCMGIYVCPMKTFIGLQKLTCEVTHA